MPDTKRGGGQSTSGPIYEKWGGNSLQVHYEKWGGGGQFASGPSRKVGGGGGGGGGGGSDVSSPIGVWGEAPEASQAGTRTT